MTQRKRTHYRYELKDGRRVVYRGITNDLERREREHRRGGKKFTHLQPVGPAVTMETAKEWEEQSLSTYRRHHGGKSPKYNKTD